MRGKTDGLLAVRHRSYDSVRWDCTGRDAGPGLYLQEKAEKTEEIEEPETHSLEAERNLREIVIIGPERERCSDIMSVQVNAHFLWFA